MFIVHSPRTRVHSRLPATTENGDERLSKLSAHRAEQDEVDGAVDESQDVEQITKVQVDSRRKLRTHAAQNHHNALRKFGDQKQDHDSQKHPRGTIGRSLAPHALNC